MKYILVFSVLFFNLSCIAQKNRMLLYAYEQKVTPGIAPAQKEDEERNGFQYYIYLTTPQSKTVNPVALWIKGVQFGVKVKDASTPIESTSPDDSAMILVPKTEQRTYRLFPVKNIPAKGPDSTSLARLNEVVLVYKMNGKFHFLAKEKLVLLKTVNRP
jgi:hypothetical protein